MLSKISLAIWAVIPVMAMAYNFGPGQEGLHRDRASRLMEDAKIEEAAAEEAQATAHAAQLVTMEARKRALLSASDEDEQEVADALEAEKEAYAIASDAWKSAADAYQVVEHTQFQLERCEGVEGDSVE